MDAELDAGAEIANFKAADAAEAFAMEHAGAELLRLSATRTEPFKQLSRRRLTRS